MRKIPKKEEKPQKLANRSIDHIFRVIDASVRVLPLITETPQRSGESWLQKALTDDPSSVEVVQKIIAPFRRTYRNPRFVHMRGQTKTISPTPTKP
ncbi:hypothetical protein [Reticulibacter mediterranei]|nr:hypothetical protein [Reticulibacter mediterranei]